MASEREQSKKGLEILEKCYNFAINGLPTSDSAEIMANEYLRKYNFNTNLAVEKLVQSQIAKCATTGFVTGLGGLITLPVAVSADVAGTVYVQLRMIASIAVMGGYNPTDDEVKTLAYMCLVGMSATDIIKTTGIKIGQKVTINVLKKLPAQMLFKINQMVGFRLITKFGTKGIINLSKAIPIVGGVIGGGIDALGTKSIAEQAKKYFINNYGM